jgi:uncharacterized protein YyaL (SSP411 family)
LIDALLWLYQAEFNPRRVWEAVRLAELMVEDFADPNGGGFFYTAVGHEPLITRTKDSYDGSTPSGNAMTATALLQLASLVDRRNLQDIAEKTLRQFAGLMRESPAGSGQMLLALDFHLGPVKEIAVVGERGTEPVKHVLRAIRGRFRPNIVVAVADPSDQQPAANAIPLLRDRQALGDVTTYVCENFTCKAPAIGVDNSIRAVESL